MSWQTFLRMNDWQEAEIAVQRSRHSRRSLSRQFGVEDWLIAQDLDSLGAIVEYRMERRAEKKAKKEREWQERQRSLYGRM